MQESLVRFRELGCALLCRNLPFYGKSTLLRLLGQSLELQSQGYLLSKRLGKLQTLFTDLTIQRNPNREHSNQLLPKDQWDPENRLHTEGRKMSSLSRSVHAVSGVIVIKGTFHLQREPTGIIAQPFVRFARVWMVRMLGGHHLAILADQFQIPFALFYIDQPKGRRMGAELFGQHDKHLIHETVKIFVACQPVQAALQHVIRLRKLGGVCPNLLPGTF